MIIVKKVLRNPFFQLCIVGILIKITTEAMSKVIGAIPSTNKLFLDLLHQTVTHHLPDTEVWRTLLTLASWLITTFFLILLAFFAYAAYKKITSISKLDPDESPPYTGHTGQPCFKSGVYRAKINPDDEQKVMSGKLFPFTVTKQNQLSPTAWEMVRRINNTRP